MNEIGFCISRANQPTHRQEERPIPVALHWSPPHEGSIKANCDVAMKKGNPKAAIAVVLRDHNGRIMGGRASTVFVTSVSQGEALAIRLAGHLLMENEISNAVIESDNKMVIHLCSTENVPPWDCAAVIEDIRASSSFCHFSFSWIPRNCNMAAHWVATQFLQGAIPAQICSFDISVESFDL